MASSYNLRSGTKGGEEVTKEDLAEFMDGMNQKFEAQSAKNDSTIKKLSEEVRNLTAALVAQAALNRAHTAAPATAETAARQHPAADTTARQHPTAATATYQHPAAATHHVVHPSTSTAATNNPHARAFMNHHQTLNPNFLNPNPILQNPHLTPMEQYENHYYPHLMQDGRPNVRNQTRTNNPMARHNIDPNFQRNPNRDFENRHRENGNFDDLDWSDEEDLLETNYREQRGE